MLTGLTVLCALLFGVLRPLIARLLTRYASDGRPAGALLATLLIGTFASAYATAYLGVHPVFGAFLFGACLPRDDRLLHSLIERIEHVAVLILMPVFFALAGLNTSADAFSGAGAGHMSLILLAAVGGKVIGGSVGPAQFVRAGLARKLENRRGSLKAAALACLATAAAPLYMRSRGVVPPVNCNRACSRR